MKDEFAAGGAALHACGEPREHEIAVLVKTGALGWKRCLRQHFELQGTDRLRMIADAQNIRIGLRSLVGGPNRSIRLFLEFRVFGLRFRDGQRFELLSGFGRCGLREALFDRFFPFRQFHGKLRFGCIDGFAQRDELFDRIAVFLLVGGPFDRRGGHLTAHFVAIVEEGEELVVFLLRDLIVFVRVAARAADREAQPHGAERLHAIHAGLDAELLLIRAAFGVRERLPMKRGGHDLLLRGLRQQITGDLLDGELIKGHVVIDRADDPVAVAPRIRPSAILFITIAVRVARHVQPVAAPAFAVAFGGQQAVDEIGECGLRIADGVFDESIHFLRSRRQAVQVVGGAFDQGDRIGLRRGLDACLLELFADEMIDGLNRIRNRDSRITNRLVSPVRLKLCTFGDPLAQHLDVAAFQRMLLAMLRRRHLLVRIGGKQARDHFTLIRFAGHDAMRAAFERLEGQIATGEHQTAFGVIRAVAFEAVLREQRLHIA